MTEQEIDKVCEWINTYLFEIGYPDDWVRDSKVMTPNGEERFRKYIKGISGNKEEISSKYDAEYLQSKIDAHTRRMEEQGLTSEQMLEECRGGDLLHWQDIRKIVKIADYIFIKETGRYATEEDYYTEVLKRFKEEKQ